MFKTQPTLDRFFGNKKINSNSADSETDPSEQYEIKRFFYLIWENKYKPNLQAYWCDKKPEKINFMEQVECNYIKKGYFFYICGYFPDINEKAYSLPKEKIYKNMKYLKSHLQKCIRKSNDMLAIPTCNHLLKLDVNEVLRRLPIIMIEDTTIHESFTTLIWLMIANSTNKFKMKQYMYEWILGVVYILCKIDKKDDFLNNLDGGGSEGGSGEGNGDEEGSKEGKGEKIEKRFRQYSKLNIDKCSLLYCINIRNAYGGTENDMIMLKKCSDIWEKRFLPKKSDKNINIFISDVRPVSILVEDLNINDWDISAIDFHCNSKLLNYISKKYDELTEEEIKKIIWHHSSNINTRTTNFDYNGKVWKQIKSYVEKTQKYLLDSE